MDVIEHSEIPRELIPTVASVDLEFDDDVPAIVSKPEIEPAIVHDFFGRAQKRRWSSHRSVSRDRAQHDPNELGAHSRVRPKDGRKDLRQLRLVTRSPQPADDRYLRRERAQLGGRSVNPKL
jgi:hypothetical protein